MDMNPSYRKRCKRWDIPFDVHHLTFSCFRRQPLLQNQRACQWFIDALGAARTKHPFALMAYVIMPEHVHLVILPREGTTISAVLKSIKLPVARKALNWARRDDPQFLSRMEHQQSNGRAAHRFWLRGGGYDRNLRSDRDIHEKISYIHENPVRRGLVENAEDWPWSSWRAHCRGVDEPIPIDRDSIPIVLS